MPTPWAQALSPLRQFSWMPLLEGWVAVAWPRNAMLAFAPGFMHTITIRLDFSAASPAHASMAAAEHCHRTEELHGNPSSEGAGGKGMSKAATAVLGFLRTLRWS